MFCSDNNLNKNAMTASQTIKDMSSSTNLHSMNETVTNKYHIKGNAAQQKSVTQNQSSLKHLKIPNT
jgi:hypothetical protein